MIRNKNYKNRFIILYCIVGIIAFLVISRLFMLQVIDGSEYSKITATRLSKSIPQKAPRGEILDRYGRPLVSNRQGFSITVSKVNSDNKELNDVVLKLINICDAGNVNYIDTMPITKEAPYKFTYEEKENIAKFNKSLNLDKNLSADNVIKELCKRYEIDNSYSQTQKRKIAGVRSEMELRLFSSLNSYTFANDVSMEVVTKIKETTHSLNGVNILTEYLREYNEPGIASHILGRVGQIYKEEYDVLKDEGYDINAVIGKDGIEKYCESILKGKDGTLNIEENETGHIVSSVSALKAVPGNDVILTIDLELQKTAEKMLKEVITNISSYGVNSGYSEGWDADSGAAVVIDIHTGEILALCSYPTYNLARFNEDYNYNYKNPAKPFWNRAIAGTYEPGSTFKMATALAGLQAGVINENTTMTCNGIYNYYAPSYTPACWKREGHGTLDVIGAIENSCNIFFYETGRLAGINRLNTLSRQLGFGKKTGIELPEEVKGIVAGPEYVETLGETWWPGDTIQAAIGQSKNLFTPIQLANYIATITNGGTRYKTHLVKRIKEYSTSNIIKEYYPVAEESIEIDAKHHKLIMEGMKSVTEDGTASSVFQGFGVSVGGKTGTAEVPNGSNNGVFVAFAPYENPQIAISVVVEHGSHGNSIAPVAKEIIAKYFTGDFLEYVDNKPTMEILR